MKVSELRRGDMVRAIAVPDWVGDIPVGTVGVCFEEEDGYGDGAGPMVRFANGGVGNMYEGWVERIDPFRQTPPFPMAEVTQ